MGIRSQLKDGLCWLGAFYTSVQKGVTLQPSLSHSARTASTASAGKTAAADANHLSFEVGTVSREGARDGQAKGAKVPALACPLTALICYLQPTEGTPAITTGTTTFQTCSLYACVAPGTKRLGGVPLCVSRVASWSRKACTARSGAIQETKRGYALIQLKSAEPCRVLVRARARGEGEAPHLRPALPRAWPVPARPLTGPLTPRACVTAVEHTVSCPAGVQRRWIVGRTSCTSLTTEHLFGSGRTQRDVNDVYNGSAECPGVRAQRAVALGPRSCALKIGFAEGASDCPKCWVRSSRSHAFSASL